MEANFHDPRWRRRPLPVVLSSMQLEGGHMPAIDPGAPAILIWLAEGVTPSDGDFQADQSWTLERAASHAFYASKDRDNRPWIKSGGRILDQNEIGQVMSGLRAMEMFGPERR